MSNQVSLLQDLKASNLSSILNSAAKQWDTTDFMATSMHLTILQVKTISTDLASSLKTLVVLSMCKTNSCSIITAPFQGLPGNSWPALILFFILAMTLSLTWSWSPGLPHYPLLALQMLHSSTLNQQQLLCSVVGLLRRSLCWNLPHVSKL